MRTDLHPLYVAPAIGDPVTLRLSPKLIDDWHTVSPALAARARRIMHAGHATVTGVCRMGIGRRALLDTGPVDVCAYDHVIHIECPDLDDRLVGAEARHFILTPAPSAAEDYFFDRS